MVLELVGVCEAGATDVAGDDGRCGRDGRLGVGPSHVTVVGRVRRKWLPTVLALVHNHTDESTETIIPSGIWSRLYNNNNNNNNVL